MSARRRYEVIYLWQGERHVASGDGLTWAQAVELQAEYIKNGWRAWIEARS